MEWHCQSGALSTFPKLVILWIFCSQISWVLAVEPAVELRGLWVASVDNIDWPSQPALSVNEQQQELFTYLDLMVEMKMNCLFFQVRPVGDAFYQSELEPWSVYLTGEQGLAPTPLWDPLAFAVEHAHSRGIQVHAWINPYRAKYHDNTWEGLAPNHMAIKFREFAYPYGSYLWMDPGAHVILDYLLVVVDDILSRYEVDGLHIDDYFYPYPEGEQNFPDNATYSDYLAGGGDLPLDDWRRDNINNMVQQLSALVWSHQKLFSISPGGLYRPGHPEGMPPPIEGDDGYSTIYADTKLWLIKGWMDWFIPQIYWAIEPPAQSYPVVLEWWLDVNTNSSQKMICAGNAVYKMDPPHDWEPGEIVDQIGLSRQEAFREKGSLGNVHFSGRFFRDDVKDVVSVIKTVYTQDASIPKLN